MGFFDMLVQKAANDPRVRRQPKGLSLWENMYFNPATGEAFNVNQLDADINIYVPTGWYFEKTTQALPNVANLEGPRVETDISPWAFLTEGSTARLVAMLQAVAPASIHFSHEIVDNNHQFPYSALPRVIVGTEGTRVAKGNAGLIANSLCRTYSFDHVKSVIQHADSMILGMAIDSFITDLRFEPE